MSQISANEIQVKVLEFRGLIKTQPQLPQMIDEVLLIRYLKTCNFDVENALNLLISGLNMRHKYPYIFTNRDVFSEEFEIALKAVDMIPLHERTPENWNVCIIRLNDYDPKLIDFNYCIKAFFMVADLRLVTPDTSTISDGEVAIFDMNGISYRHMTKVVFSTLKMFSKYTQEAHPICVRQTHIVNCSSMLGYLVNIAKPMIHADVLERIHFHFPKSDTLSKFIPTEMLPEEYSGNGGRMGDLKKYWIERLKEKRDYLMNDANWKITKHHPKDDKLKEKKLLNLSSFLQIKN